MVPNGWEVKKFGDLFNVKSGFGFKHSEYADSGTPLIKIDNVSHGYVKWNNVSYLPDSYREDYSDILNEAEELLDEKKGKKRKAAKKKRRKKKKKAKGKKDACYHKVRSRYDVWPSAYASGALVKCRKVGAKNWGNSTKEELELDEDLLEEIIKEEVEETLEEKKRKKMT